MRQAGRTVFYRDLIGSAGPWAITAVGLLLITVVAWIFAYSKGYETAYLHHQASYATDQRAMQGYTECMAKLTVDDAIDCYRAAEKTTREDYRLDENLNAQRKTANFAEAAVWVSLVIGAATTIVTTVGVIYVALTLKEARATTRAAVEGTDAAWAAVAHAEKETEMLKGQRIADTRPWLTFTYHVHSVILDEGRTTIYYAIKVRNHGNTPALCSETGRACRYEERNFDDQLIKDATRSARFFDDTVSEIIMHGEVSIRPAGMVSFRTEYGLSIINVAFAIQYKMQGYDGVFETVSAFDIYFVDENHMQKREPGIYLEGPEGFEVSPNMRASWMK